MSSGGGVRSSVAKLNRPQATTKRRSGGNSKMSSSVPATLDLREVIDSARKTFKRDVKNSASSTPASLSPKSSTLQQQPEPPKSASAPVSPVKQPDPVPTGKRTRLDKPPASVAKRLRRSTNSLLIQTSSTPLSNSTDRMESEIKPFPKNSSEDKTSPQNDSENQIPPKIEVSRIECKELSSKKKSPSPTPATPTPKTPKHKNLATSYVDEDMKRKPSNNVSMNEVIKLHQDEGVMHLLHALPSSRRKPTQMVSIVSRRPSANGTEPRSATPASATSTQPTQSFSQQPHQVYLNLGRTQTKPILQDRTTNFLTSHLERTTVKPCSQEELMNSQALALIKQLPSKEYIRLWSSPSRYVLVNDDTSKKSTLLMTVQTSNSSGTPNVSTSSPSSSVSSDMSSVSAARQLVNLQPPPRQVAWTINPKNYKDILIRTYPTFAQILISPVTTGLKNSINSNVCEELIDALRQFSNEPECRAVLISGIGSTFCQGVDLTVLTYDSADRQRRSAENLAGSIKKLATFMLSYPKILLAGVNGVARGIGVTLLPFFDVVFASDKATFATDYARLGQIPECFASHSLVAGHLALNEILLFGKTATASEAVRYGLVSSVVWPDKFLEEIVPRVEALQIMSASGLNLVKTNMKQSLKKSVTSSVMEEETKLLIQNWTCPTFAKNVRAHLKTNYFSFQ